MMSKDIAETATSAVALREDHVATTDRYFELQERPHRHPPASWSVVSIP